MKPTCTRSLRLCLLYGLLLFPPHCNSLLTVYAPAEGAGTYESSIYQFYGPRAATVQGLGFFVDGPSLCKVKADVRSRIVFSDRRESDCDLGEIYKRLSAAGALAFVHIVFYNPPGLMSHAHFTHDTNKYRRHPMTMADVSKRYCYAFAFMKL